MDSVKSGQSKLLYVAPERFENLYFAEKIKQLNPKFVFVDEAHCISVWGHDFRVEYRNLKVLKKIFPGTPIIALTAFAGAGFGNGLTYALSLWGMASKKIQARNWLFYFFFWWNVNSLGNFIDYVPSRTFGTHVSPWWIMIILGYLVLWAVWYFYTKTLVRAYDVLSLKKASARAVLLIFVTLILFALYGMIGFDGYGPLSHFISQLSLWIMLPILVFCWPTRLWVKTALKTKFI